MVLLGRGRRGYRRRRKVVERGGRGTRVHRRDVLMLLVLLLLLLLVVVVRRRGRCDRQLLRGRGRGHRCRDLQRNRKARRALSNGFRNVSVHFARNKSVEDAISRGHTPEGSVSYATLWPTCQRW